MSDKELDKQYERLTTVINECLAWKDVNCKVIDIGRPKDKHYRAFMKKYLKK